MHKQRFKSGSSVTSWKAGQIIFNDFNNGIPTPNKTCLVQKCGMCVSLCMWMSVWIEQQQE